MREERKKKEEGGSRERKKKEGSTLLSISRADEDGRTDNFNEGVTGGFARF